jgi:hypothetical protein
MGRAINYAISLDNTEISGVSRLNVFREVFILENVWMTCLCYGHRQINVAIQENAICYQKRSYMSRDMLINPGSAYVWSLFRVHTLLPFGVLSLA